MKRATPLIMAAMLIAMAGHGAVLAQSTPANASPTALSADIVIDAGTQDDAQAGTRLRDAARVFDQHRGSFAPDADLYFQVRPNADAAAAFPTLSLSVDDNPTPLPVNSDGRIIVPLTATRDGSWRLTIAGNTGGVTLRPLILSPGTSLAERRVGDLRLQCRVFFAMASEAMPAETRAAFERVGGCSGALFEFNMRSERPIAAALLNGTTPLTLVRDGAAVRIPINDPTITNDARIAITFRD